MVKSAPLGGPELPHEAPLLVQLDDAPVARVGHVDELGLLVGEDGRGAPQGLVESRQLEWCWLAA